MENKIKGYFELLYEGKGESVYSDYIELIEKWKSKVLNEGSKTISEKDVMLITYGDSIVEGKNETLKTLNKFSNEYFKNIFSSIHILPMFPYTSDDGFSVTDYYKINESLGDWNDLMELKDNFALMYDAVVNHCSKSNEWFKKFLEKEDGYENYFTKGDPSKDYSTVTRPRALPLFTDFKSGNEVVHVWTTFSDDQVDLNFREPKVLFEVIEILLTYAERGAKYIRLDAIGFIWKKLGTTCMHLEETHAIVKLMRHALDSVFGDVIIITETNVPHEDNVSYFGGKDKEAHMVYQFPLPPLTLFSILKGDSTKLMEWADSLKETELKEDTTFFNFLASHDGIGLRPTEGILTNEEKEFVVSKVKEHGGFVNYKNNPDGSKSPYELNITYMDALTDPKEADENIRINRFLAATSILLSVKGLPAIYIHSVLGSQNYYKGVEESGINRRINREKLDYNRVCHELRDENSLRNKIYTSICELIKLRSEESAFNPYGDMEVCSLDPRLFSVMRTNKETNEKILAVVNVSNETVKSKINASGVNILDNEEIIDELNMKPYETKWIKCN